MVPATCRSHYCIICTFSAAYTDVQKLSPSLLSKICSCDPKPLQTPAVQWGCDNEPFAIKTYTALTTGLALPAGLNYPQNIWMLTPPMMALKSQSHNCRAPAARLPDLTLHIVLQQALFLRLTGKAHNC